MANSKELQNIQKEFEKMYPGQVIEDGIVNPDNFATAKYKILWVLKEPNDPDKGNWPILDFVSSLENLINGYPKWRRTFKLMIKSSYAILHGITNHVEIPSESEENVGNILSSVAIINVSKVGGSACSNYKDIANHFEKNKSLLLRQVNAIDPDLIINCSRDSSIEKLLEAKDYKKIDRFYVANTSNYKIIGAYHPNCRTIPHEEYLKTMLTCVKSLNL